MFSFLLLNIFSSNLVMKSINKFKSTSKNVEGLINQLKANIKIETNSNPLTSQIIDTPVGSILAISNDKHLLLLEFVDSKTFDSTVKRVFQKTRKDIVEGSSKLIDSIKLEFEQYFNGNLMEFTTPILLEFESEVSTFSTSVWKEIHKIPFGERITYSEIAKNINNPSSYRAVANACGKNPFSIVVPCHRVVGSNETLGGYSSGIEKKIWLQNHERQMLSK